jgi:hypothetical protein
MRQAHLGQWHLVALRAEAPPHFGEKTSRFDVPIASHLYLVSQRTIFEDLLNDPDCTAEYLGHHRVVHYSLCRETGGLVD